MRLSDAIRLGAMLRRQCFGGTFLLAGSCAEGAACEATGMIYQEGMDDALAIRHMQDTFTSYNAVLNLQCPVCGSDRRSHSGGVIAHLNDWHRWTREQIADWIATIEPPDIPQPEPQEAVSVKA